jgi:hypothetical protein
MSEGKDPLDELSSCYIEKDGKLHEMTPRELAKYCADEMVLWDSLWHLGRRPARPAGRGPHAAPLAQL